MSNTFVSKKCGAVLIMVLGSSSLSQADSPASVANAAASRGKVVGSFVVNSAMDIVPGDIDPATSTSEERQRRLRPLPAGYPATASDYVDASTPRPVSTVHLPPGRVYCNSTRETPEGYLTSNCQVDVDCASPALCDGQLCRTPCTSDSGVPLRRCVPSSLRI